MIIRSYKADDETRWLRCRVLAFLDTAYYDSVYNSKEKYENPSIELVAEVNGTITGLIDLELDTDDKKVCSKGSGKSAMIWHIAVHPDHRRHGIASKLLHEAEQICKKNGIKEIEAWTRDDQFVRNWYTGRGFKITDSYLHLNLEHEEMKGIIESKIDGIIPVKMFAHYTKGESEKIRNSFRRVNECVMFKKIL